MFCQRCTEMLLAINRGEGQENNYGEPELEYHTSYNEFQKALLMGCVICNKMQGRGKVTALEVEQQAIIYLGCTYQLYTPDSRIAVSLDGIMSLDKLKILYHKSSTPRRIRTDPSEDRMVLVENLKARNTGSASCFAVANHWLKTCLHQHSNCERPRPPGAEDWRPTRLVYIGRSMRHLHLCEKEDVPVGVKYATLSHCWGQISERLVLTNANIGIWKKDIPDLGRMKTFQDAVMIVAQLGMNYLWIDSLCIIQDSKDDWSQEASLMSDVYKFSQCTITATAAIDDTGGCFRERDPLEVFPTRFQIVKDQQYFPKAPRDVELVAQADSLVGERHAELLQGIFELPIEDSNRWRSNISASPVSARSWIVQERLLSPRVLHYARDELFWECAELQASESEPFGTDKYLISSSAMEFKASNPFQYQNEVSLYNGIETASQRSNLLSHGFRIWEVAVEAYTAGKLTYPEDKLVAISAIAREVQHLLKCRYLAGLWEFELVRQLDWSVVSDGDGPRTSTYRAPSWSWASVDGQIFWHPKLSKHDDPSYRFLVDVLEATTELVGEDELGQVCGGHIRLLGQTIDLQIEDGDIRRSKNLVSMENRSIDVHCFLDDEASTSRTRGSLCCLPLWARKLNFKGLVLETASGGVSDGTYRRVGVLARSFEDHGDSMNHLLFSLFGKWKLGDDGTWLFERNESAMREIVII